MMEVELTADQKAFARQAIATGRVHGEEEVVQEALSLWEGRERTRTELLAELDRAEAAVERGGGRVITLQSMQDLALAVQERGRSRLKRNPATF